MNNTKICTNICELVLTFLKLKIALFSALHNSLKKSIVICHFPEMRMSSHNSFLNSQKKNKLIQKLPHRQRLFAFC